MIKNLLFVSALLFSTSLWCKGQIFFKASSLFPVTVNSPGTGSLNLIQDPSVDTLLSRHILRNKLISASNGSVGGMEGFRIQIYRSLDRDLGEKSNKVRAEFMVLFPDIPSYALFEKPGYYLVRAGNFRTKLEGTPLLFEVKKKYRNAYLVQDVIYFPELNKN